MREIRWEQYGIGVLGWGDGLIQSDSKGFEQTLKIVLGVVFNSSKTGMRESWIYVIVSIE